VDTGATQDKRSWRIIVVGGHTRSIGKTELVCDVMRAFPEENWIAGKITQYGHGVCAKNGENCGCAPNEHSYAISWEKDGTTGTDSSRFLAAGAKRSFWLHTQQGFLAEGLPLLREALAEIVPRIAPSLAQPTLIIESNSLLQFVQPSLYFAVMDPDREDFKDSARAVIDRADALILHQKGAWTSGDTSESPQWMKLPAQRLREVPSVRQLVGEPLPVPLQVMVRRVLEGTADVKV
jgi:molybdopterin-guanine dinucleotide biosynthesis protein